MRRRGLVLVLALLLAASGCFGGGKERPQETGGPRSNGTGNATVSGIVLDEQLLPLEGVRVAVAAVPDVATRSGPNGTFVLDGVPPGTHQLVASLQGFKDGKKAVRVGAGDIVEGLEFRLAAIQFEGAARTETFLGQGRIACASGHALAPMAAPVWQTCRQDPNHRNAYTFQVAMAGLFTVVLELEWTPTVPGTAEELRQGLWRDPACSVADGCEAGFVVGEIAGPSPLWHQYGSVQRPLRETLTQTDTFVTLGSVVNPPHSQPFPEGDVADPKLVMQQPFSHYVTAFYNSEAAHGYTLRPPA